MIQISIAPQNNSGKTKTREVKRQTQMIKCICEYSVGYFFFLLDFTFNFTSESGEHSDLCK